MPRPFFYCATSVLVLLAGCGGTAIVKPAGPQFSFALASSSATAFPSEPSAIVAVMVTRTGSSAAALTVSVAGLPTGATATVQSPGTGNAGSVALAAGTASPGNYALTVTATDGTNPLTEPLTLVVGVTAVVANSSTSTLNEAMSTSFQIAEWTGGLFPSSPNMPAQLTTLAPQHVNMQILSQAIPQTAADTWDFSLLDQSMQPVLSASDHSPLYQIANAPGFMYVAGTQTFTDPTFQQFADHAANLVRYYNTGGFTAGGTAYKSPSAYPITWWGIYNEPNINGITPDEYVQIYNKVVPAMQAADPGIKFAAVELADFSSEEQRYIPTFVAGVTAQVDVLATHFYSSCNQRDTDQQLMDTVAVFASGVRYLYSELATNPKLAHVPVWVLENNVNADYEAAGGLSNCNPGQTFVPDARGSSAFFAGWRAYEFSQLGKAGAQSLHHWSYPGDVQYGEFNTATGQLQLSYWVDYWLGRYYPSPAGAAILDVTNTDEANVEVLAVKKAAGQVVVMVADHAVASATDNNGKGAPRTVLVDLSALGAFTGAKQLTLDATTDPANGPTEKTVTVVPQMQVTLGGYGATFLTLQ